MFIAVISGGSTFKSAVFSSSSSLPPHISEGGGLVIESGGKDDLLLDHFDYKQSREAVDLPLPCHPCPGLATFAFRSNEVRYLLLDLDLYGGTDKLGMFPPFLKRTAGVMPPVTVLCFGSLFVWVVSGLLETGQCHPKPERSTVLLCCQLPTDFHNISIV